MLVVCFVITILTSRIVTLSLKILNNEEHKFELQIFPYDAHIFFSPSALCIVLVLDAFKRLKTRIPVKCVQLILLSILEMSGLIELKSANERLFSLYHSSDTLKTLSIYRALYIILD